MYRMAIIGMSLSEPHSSEYPCPLVSYPILVYTHTVSRLCRAIFQDNPLNTAPLQKVTVFPVGQHKQQWTVASMSYIDYQVA